MQELKRERKKKKEEGDRQREDFLFFFLNAQEVQTGRQRGKKGGKVKADRATWHAF